jgi:predicted permease
VGSTVPLRDNEVELQIKAEDVPPNPDMPTPRAEYRTATPEYFAATGIPILAGRAFEATETKESGLVVILNETLAKRLFPEGIDPIGRRVAWTGSVLEFIPVTGDWRTVVGIAGDTHSAALDQEPRPAMYQPFEQEEVLAGSLVVRSAGDPESLLLPATQIVRRVDPSVPIGKVGTLASLREESVANQRVNALLVSGFGVVALLIAAVGLAGVLGFSVSQRTGEIGVRMSLGAEPGQVRRMVVREGVTLLLIGLVLGAVGSVFATKVVEGMLFGVAPNDPTTLGAVALLMVTVGVTAAWVPAMRASRVQPVEALRQE